MALAAAAGAAVAISISKGNSPDQLYSCKSTLDLGQVVKASQKGIAIDDTTFEKCASQVPSVWPNSQAPLTSFRFFKAWESDWPGNSVRDAAWHDVLQTVHRRNAQVLVGAQVTCNETADEQDWKQVVELLKLLGRDHVMGVAIGNEMELLQFKAETPPECTHRMWEGGYFASTLAARVADLDRLDGFQGVPVTSVFGAYILAGQPFVETPGAMVNSFIETAVKQYGHRWVFTLNIYPYFDPGNRLDPGTEDECSEALNRTVCFHEGCLLPGTVSAMRARMLDLTKNTDYRLWLGETGWSFPQADSLGGANPAMAKCPEWSSREAFLTYYKNFLRWDLSVGQGHRGPDHVFFFSPRDSENFGVSEYFGLIHRCNSTDCKLQDNFDTIEA